MNNKELRNDLKQECEQLTIEEYRKIKGFENITQQEYNFLSETMYELAQILFEYDFLI